MIPFFNLFKDSFSEWLSSASEQELEEGYEERRKEWIQNRQNGTGIKTEEMQRIEREMARRTAERIAQNPVKHNHWSDKNRWE